jgi:succinate-semialdehyde dehydrogenase/glutarate-semialdehyde dehydrogenase
MPTRVFRSINPATEQTIAEYPLHPPAEIDRRMRQAAAGFSGWRSASILERGTLLRSVAGVMRSRRSTLAALMTAEMGKPITQAEAEADKCADACEYFAEHAEAMLAETVIESDAGRSYVRYDPTGAVLAIMPWNFPLWQVIRFAAPTLMTGNVAILKHAPNVCGTALALEQLFSDAGFPPGIFTTLLIDTPAVEKIIRDPLVSAVTLTGSERAGRAVAAIAGSALKKTVLELGGSDPFIVLSDADISAAAAAAAAARCVNSGQSCIAAKRFIVESSIGDEFEAAFAIEMAGITVGDPTKRSIQVGPLARKDLLDKLTGQVARSVDAGARVIVGGHHADRGYFYPPAVLTEVTPGMAVFDEETFGPVAAVARAATRQDLVRLANATSYGLGASIWTNNPGRAERLIPLLNAGAVFINGPVKSDPRLPFGGTKSSGYGRELSTAGIHEFVNVKTVWIR